MQKINKFNSMTVDSDCLSGGGSGSSDDILGVDVDGLRELAESLNGYAEEMSTCLESIYYIIEHLGDGAWSGEYYNEFVKMCNLYKDGLRLYVSSISLHAVAFATAADEGEQLIKDVKSACMRFSGGGGGASVGGHNSANRTHTVVAVN
ncbi:MAG: hypothetical protein IKQ29_01370 [Bacilli bacterium]|nr:hypothetical protein [Bacilli bacterium]